MTRSAAIYARVSSDRQKENHTISSQFAALEEYAGSHGYLVPPEWRFQDEGYSGATLLRPGLEALRDLAAGQPRPPPRCSTAEKARLAISLKVNPVEAA